MSDLNALLADLGLEVDPESLPVLLLLALCAVGFALALVGTVLRRLAAGAGVGELLRTGGREVVPARVLCHTVRLAFVSLFWAAVASGVHAAWRAVQAWREQDVFDVAQVVWFAGAVAVALLARRLGGSWKRGVLEAPEGAPPRVRVQVGDVQEGIDRERLATLGAERFPNHIAPGWRAELRMRWVLLFAHLALVVGICWVAAAAAATADEGGLAASVRDGAQAALGRLPGWFDATLALPLGYGCAVLFGILVFSNRDYALRSFFDALLRLTCLQLLLIACVAGGARTVDSLAVVTVLSSSLLAWRMGADLRVAGRYRRRQRVCGELDSTLGDAAQGLQPLLLDSGCRLPPLDVEALGERITQGAANLNEAGSLVVRRFGRFMRLASVRHEACVVAMQRFLSVDRFVKCEGGWPTSAPLRSPLVPCWDEQRFPLQAPDGYVDLIDPLPLSEGWNVVNLCHRCGGSGQIQETEYYTEYEYVTEWQNGQQVQVHRSVQKSRTVWRTCPTCNGACHLEYQQVLVTQWSRLQVGNTDPRLPMPELIEGAEEAVFHRRPIVENRSAASGGEQSSIEDPRWRQHVSGLGAQLAARAAEHADLVGGVIPGIVYRADFQVAGFHMIGIDFGLLGGRRGWFFGKRPEFFFPRLPLCWSKVAMLVCVPPLAVFALALAVSAATLLVTAPEQLS